jgi:hypothetical protein
MDDSKNSVVPQAAQNPRRLCVEDAYQAGWAEPGRNRNLSSATPTQLTKAAPWASRHQRQWQWTKNSVGGEIAKRTAPQRQRPSNLLTPRSS